MKRNIKTWLGALAVIAALWGVARADDGTKWEDDGQQKSACGGGNQTCQIWEQWGCYSSPILASQECDAGASERRDITSGYCVGNTCNSGQ